MDIKNLSSKFNENRQMLNTYAEEEEIDEDDFDDDDED